MSKFSIIPSVLSFRVNLIQTIPRLGDILSDIDQLTVFDLSAKSLISLRLLQMCTLVAISISQQFYFKPCNVKAFGYQLSILGVCSVLMFASCITKALPRIFSNPQGCILPSIYLTRSFRCFI